MIVTDEVKRLLLEYQYVDRRGLIEENNELRKKVEDLQKLLDESIKLNKEWLETNRKWQDLCGRLMER